MTIRNALAGIAVHDLAAASAWYARLLGREPDAAPMPGVAEWAFPAGGWLQLFVDAAHAGHGSLTLVVDDIAAARDRLRAQDHAIEWDFDGDVTSGAVIRDPDGNRVVMAQSQDPVRNPSAAGGAGGPG